MELHHYSPSGTFMKTITSIIREGAKEMRKQRNANKQQVTIDRVLVDLETLGTGVMHKQFALVKKSKNMAIYSSLAWLGTCLW